MKLGGANDDEKVGLLIDYLRGMNDALNIPHCIQHYGPDSYPTEQGFVPENVFLERLPEIAKNAIADACTGSNPASPVRRRWRSCSSAATTTPRWISDPSFLYYASFPMDKSPAEHTALRGFCRLCGTI